MKGQGEVVGERGGKIDTRLTCILARLLDKQSESKTDDVFLNTQVFTSLISRHLPFVNF